MPSVNRLGIPCVRRAQRSGAQKGIWQGADPHNPPIRGHGSNVSRCEGVRADTQESRSGQGLLIEPSPPEMVVAQL